MQNLQALIKVAGTRSSAKHGTKSTLMQNLQALIKVAGTLSAPAPPSQTEDQARQDLRQVRTRIDNYIKQQWEGLINYRNTLMGTSLFTSVFTYILLVSVIIAKAPPTIIMGMALFYFVGAGVGLLSRLTSEFNSNNPSINDYGLTAARIIVTPVLSGLAALLGVALATMLTLSLTTFQPNTTSSASPTTTPVVVATIVATTGTSTTIQFTVSQQPPASNKPAYPPLQNIYDLTQNPQGIVFAAIFGFLPSLVIGLLQQQAQTIQSQIQSSSAGNQQQNTNTNQGSSNSGSNSSGNTNTTNQSNTSPSGQAGGP